MKVTKKQLKEAFEYLDQLRKSGKTNMWGAPAYLARRFPILELDSQGPAKVTKAWMDTFGQESVEERVNKVKLPL